MRLRTETAAATELLEQRQLAAAVQTPHVVFIGSALEILKARPPISQANRLAPSPPPTKVRRLGGRSD
jgi:hypothetical protein